MGREATALRVALGPMDPAGTAGAYAAGLRALGADAELVTTFPHPFGFPADRVLGRGERIRYGATVARRRDVLHLHYGYSWLPGELDARLARRLGRTVLMNFHGDDCRLYGLAAALFPAQAPVGDASGDAAVRRRTRRLSRVAHAAIVKDLELAAYVYPVFSRVFVVPSPIRPELFEAPPALPPPGTPVVVHAPSDRRYKGTDLIVAAVAEISGRTPVELRLVENVGHEQVRAEIARATVVVDQVNAAATGVLALESMALGVPVLAEYDPDVLAPFQRPAPVVRVTPATLADELERLLGDFELRRALAEAGRRYVEAFHAPERVAAGLLRVYDHARSGPDGLFEATPDALRPLRGTRTHTTAVAAVEEGVV